MAVYSMGQASGSTNEEQPKIKTGWAIPAILALAAVVYLGTRGRSEIIRRYRPFD